MFARGLTDAAGETELRETGRCTSGAVGERGINGEESVVEVKEGAIRVRDERTTTAGVEEIRNNAERALHWLTEKHGGSVRKKETGKISRNDHFIQVVVIKLWEARKGKEVKRGKGGGFQEEGGRESMVEWGIGSGEKVEVEGGRETEKGIDNKRGHILLHTTCRQDRERVGDGFVHSGRAKADVIGRHAHVAEEVVHVL